MPDPGSSEPWSADHFASRTQAVCETAAVALRTRSANIEDAVNELLELLIQQLDEEEEDDNDDVEGSKEKGTVMNLTRGAADTM